MITDHDGKKTTAKKVAQIIARIQLNCCAIEDEIDSICDKATPKERKEIEQQYYKVAERMMKKYANNS